MCMMADYRFLEGSRVKLRDVVQNPDLYAGMACLGNEGWVAARRKDKFNLPEVYIRWDKNHWTYNGAPDCWTFEEHFDLVKEPMTSSNKREQVQALLNQFGEGLVSLLGDDAPQSPEAAVAPEPTPPAPVDNSRAEYAEAANIAAEKIKGSEAFILVGVDRESHPSTPDGILIPYAIGYGLTEEADMLATAQVGKIASKAHEALVLQVIANGDK